MVGADRSSVGSCQQTCYRRASTKSEWSIVDYRIVFDLENVDLDDETTLESVSATEYEVAWGETDGHLTATVFADVRDPISLSIKFADWVDRDLGGRVLRVNEEFVGVADIAAHFGLNRETVRLWTLGKRGSGGFPRPRATIGGGTRPTRVWAWSDVAAWLFDAVAIEPDYRCLNASQVARINAALTSGPAISSRHTAWNATGPLRDSEVSVSLRERVEWDESLSLPLELRGVGEITQGFSVAVKEHRYTTATLTYAQARESLQ